MEQCAAVMGASISSVKPTLEPWSLGSELDGVGEPDRPGRRTTVGTEGAQPAQALAGQVPGLGGR